MLCMGFFKSLIKEHGHKYYEPIGKALYARRHQSSPTWPIRRT